MSLMRYEEVVDAEIHRGLSDRISRPQGNAGLMPKGSARLPQNNIDLIMKWENDGLLE